MVCDVGYLPGRMHRRAYTGAQLYQAGHRCLAARDRTQEPPELLAQYRVVDLACPHLSDLVLSPRGVVPPPDATTLQKYRVCRKCHNVLGRTKGARPSPWACANGFLIGKFPLALEHLNRMTVAETAACALVHMKGRVQVGTSSNVRGGMQTGRQHARVSVALPSCADW